MTSIARVPPQTRPIRFHHRGRLVEVADAPPTRTVLEWLREDARCTGTKEGCAEGDCGACTVVVGETAEDGGLSLAAVNACIRFLPTLDGRALFTVEDLARGEMLHPVQQAMVECHASQCGFCTPGFVMSLWALYENGRAAGWRPGRQEIGDALTGNLCRCTGYRPILDAGKRMFDLPEVRLDRRGVLDSLASMAGSAPHRHEARQPLLPGAPRQVLHAPRTLEELASLRLERPEAQIVAGATDIGLWITKQLRELPELLWIGEVDSLRIVRERPDGVLSIGAGASLEDAWRALTARHPELREMWRRFGSPPVRHAGTMGGNVANGSPIGDSAPVLLALGATLVLRRGARVRRLPIEDFYVDYMKTRLEPGEFLVEIEVPRAPQGALVRAWKMSKRFDSDISAVSLVARLVLEGDRLADARIAFGGMAAIVRRAEAAESALSGRAWTVDALRAAQFALETDFAPITDLRASREYRVTVAKNLLERLWLETRAQGALPAALTNVRASHA